MFYTHVYIFSSLYEDICDNLAAFERRRRCPRMLRDYKIQCYCPFRAGTFSFKNLAVNIPKIGGFAGAFVKVRVSIDFFYFPFLFIFYMLHKIVLESHHQVAYRKSASLPVYYNTSIYRSLREWFFHLHPNIPNNNTIAK